jgi:coproporphyrinogen III oxidase
VHHLRSTAATSLCITCISFLHHHQWNNSWAGGRLKAYIFPCRYFETQEWNGIPGQWWFGGGTDITPAYIDEEDMKHFHGTYKEVTSSSSLPPPHPLPQWQTSCQTGSTAEGSALL